MTIVATHHRPLTGNNNPFAESIFATLKGRIVYPEYYKTIEASLKYVEGFVKCNNFEHQHSSIDVF